MTKTMICALLAGSLAGCRNEQSGTLNDHPSSEHKNTAFAALPDHFEPVSFDTLHIFNEKEFGKFKGEELDSATAALFPEKIKEDVFGRGQGIFACYKFPVDENRTALIARTPAEYRPSSIKLFIHDKRENRLGDYIELANLWGDAGDVSDKISWLFRSEHGRTELYISHIESHDNSIEHPEDRSMTTKSNNYLVGISENGFDTLSRDPKLLAAKFKRPQQGKR